MLKPNQRMRKLLDEQMELGIAQTREELEREQQSNGKAPERIVRLRVIPPPSLRGWLQRQIRVKGRIVRWLSWWCDLPFRAWSFVLAVTGGRVDSATHRERMAACESCPRRALKITRRGLRSHCGSCGCPAWFMSRLDRKNWWRRWYCPAKRHPGPYPEDAWRDLVEAENAKIVSIDAAVPGATLGDSPADGNVRSGGRAGGCGCGST